VAFKRASVIYARVARWYILKLKIPILQGLGKGKVGIHILWPFCIFYGHLVYFMAIWYILWPFGNLVAIQYSSPPAFWYIAS
jgi:hypothetical protein